MNERQDSRGTSEMGDIVVDIFGKCNLYIFIQALSKQTILLKERWHEILSENDPGQGMLLNFT